MMMTNRTSVASGNKTVPEKYSIFCKLVCSSLDFLWTNIPVFTYSLWIWHTFIYL